MSKVSEGSKDVFFFRTKASRDRHGADLASELIVAHHAALLHHASHWRQEQDKDMSRHVKTCPTLNTLSERALDQGAESGGDKPFLERRRAFCGAQTERGERWLTLVDNLNIDFTSILLFECSERSIWKMSRGICFGQSRSWRIMNVRCEVFDGWMSY